MRGFKTVAPPQPYMTLSEIHKKFGMQGVVAYGCTLNGEAPEGGYVIAVQEGPDSKGIKAYLRQFKAKFPQKETVQSLLINLL